MKPQKYGPKKRKADSVIGGYAQTVPLFGVVLLLAVVCKFAVMQVVTGHGVTARAFYGFVAVCSFLLAGGLGYALLAGLTEITKDSRSRND